MSAPVALVATQAVRYIQRKDLERKLKDGFGRQAVGAALDLMASSFLFKGSAFDFLCTHARGPYARFMRRGLLHVAAGQNEVLRGKAEKLLVDMYGSLETASHRDVVLRIFEASKKRMLTWHSRKVFGNAIRKAQATARLLGIDKEPANGDLAGDYQMDILAEVLEVVVGEIGSGPRFIFFSLPLLYELHDVYSTGSAPEPRTAPLLQLPEVLAAFAFAVHVQDSPEEKLSDWGEVVRAVGVLDSIPVTDTTRIIIDQMWGAFVYVIKASAHRQDDSGRHLLNALASHHPEIVARMELVALGSLLAIGPRHLSCAQTLVKKRIRDA